jgi:hypothetical protein
MLTPRTARRSITSLLDGDAAAVFGVRIPDQRRYSDAVCRAVRVADGVERDVFADRRTGIIDVEDLRVFASGGDLEVATAYDLSGGRRHCTFAAGRRPLIVKAGVVNTVGGMPIYVSTGTTRGTIAVALTWAMPMVANIVLAATSRPTGAGYIVGADTSASSYRDIQLSVAPASWTLTLGEGIVGMSPNTSALAQDTASIITAIRTGSAGAVKGYLIQNDVITSTFTTERQSTDINPNTVSIFTDPDDALSFAPAGWGFQELWLFNASPPPSGEALSALHASQSEVYGIPLRGTLAWPIAVTRSLLTSSGGALTTSSALKITYR